MGYIAQAIATAKNVRAGNPDTPAGQPIPGEVRYVQNVGTGGEHDGTGHWQIALFNGVGSPLTLGNLYQIDFTGSSATGPKAITIATGAAATGTTHEVVSATSALATGSVGWFKAAGVCDNVMVEGTTNVAVGDFLRVVIGTSAVAFVKESVGWMTDNTYAVAMEAQEANSAVAVKVRLLGREALILPV